MHAAFYINQGPADSVLQIGEQPIPEPQEGEVRIHRKNLGSKPFGC